MLAVNMDKFVENLAANLHSVSCGGKLQSQFSLIVIITLHLLEIVLTQETPREALVPINSIFCDELFDHLQETALLRPTRAASLAWFRDGRFGLCTISKEGSLCNGHVQSEVEDFSEEHFTFCQDSN